MSDSQSQGIGQMFNAVQKQLAQPRRRDGVPAPGVWQHAEPGPVRESVRGAASAKAKEVEPLPWQGGAPKPPGMKPAGAGPAGPADEGRLRRSEAASRAILGGGTKDSPSTRGYASPLWGSARVSSAQRRPLDLLRRRLTAQSAPAAARAKTVDPSAIAEIGSGVKHLMTGAVEIVSGAITGVTATGRYTLLGIRYGIGDSVGLVRGAIGLLCPSPKRKS